MLQSTNQTQQQKNRLNGWRRGRRSNGTLGSQVSYDITVHRFLQSSKEEVQRQTARAPLKTPRPGVLSDACLNERTALEPCLSGHASMCMRDSNQTTFDPLLPSLSLIF